MDFFSKIYLKKHWIKWTFKIYLISTGLNGLPKYTLKYTLITKLKLLNCHRLQVQVVSQFSYFSNRFEFSEGIYQNANCNKVKISKPENICHLDVEGYFIASNNNF